MNDAELPMLQSHSKQVRFFFLFMAVTAVLSLIYGLQALAGSPAQLIVTSEILDLDSNAQGIVAAAGQDGTVRLWDLENYWALRPLSVHRGPVVNVGFDPSGSTLFSAGRDGTVRYWNVQSGQVQRTLEIGSPLRAAAMSADGQYLATLDDGRVVRVWSVSSDESIQEIRLEGDPRGALAINADGSLLATADGPNVQIWSVDSGELVQYLEGYWQRPDVQETWMGHNAPINTLYFSPDDTILGSGSEDTTVVFWELDTGEVMGVVERHWSAVTKVILSDDGNTFLSSSRDTKALSGRPGSKNVTSYSGHLGGVNSVAFGFAPNTIVTGGEDGTVREWDSVDGIPIHLEWSRPGFTPIWGRTLTMWMLVSGVLGLFCLWGLWRQRGWSHLLALGVFLIGPIIVIGLPLFEVTSYPLSAGQKLILAWPLILMALWYGALLILLTRQAVAFQYEAPLAAPLADQLMSRRRTLRARFGIFAGAVWILVLVALYSVLRRFNLDVSFMQHFFSFIMTGAGTTLFVSATSIVLATLLALFGALGRLSRNPVANGVSGFYVSLIRGTPLLVQIYIWYLGLPRLNVYLPELWAGILALSVNYGAYMTEIFRAGIQAIGKGQYEASYALGMSGAQTLRRIVLPQAFRIVIPPIGNEFIAMMKDSSLVSIMGVWELTFRAEKIGRQYFRGMETFIIAAAFYWILTVIFQFFQGKLEDYMARGERR